MLKKMWRSSRAGTRTRSSRHQSPFATARPESAPLLEELAERVRERCRRHDLGEKDDDVHGDEDLRDDEVGALPRTQRRARIAAFFAPVGRAAHSGHLIPTGAKTMHSVQIGRPQFEQLTAVSLRGWR